MKRVPIHEQRIYLTPAELIKLGLGWDPGQFGRTGAAATLAEVHLQDDPGRPMSGGKRLCLVWRETGPVSEISVDVLQEPGAGG